MAARLRPSGYGATSPLWACRAEVAKRRRREESPGSTETRCRITSGGGDPRDSATENKPPGEAPRGTKTGKGETVRQERTARTATDAARQAPPGARPNRDGARPVSGLPSGSVARGVRRRASQRNGHLPAQAGNRTRLTGHLTRYCRLGSGWRERLWQKELIGKPGGAAKSVGCLQSVQPICGLKIRVSVVRFRPWAPVKNASKISTFLKNEGRFSMPFSVPNGAKPLQAKSMGYEGGKNILRDGCGMEIAFCSRL